MESHFNINLSKILVDNSKKTENISESGENILLPENILNDFDSLKTSDNGNTQLSNNSSTPDLLTTAKEEWDSGHESNSAFNTFSSNKVIYFIYKKFKFSLFPYSMLLLYNKILIVLHFK